MTRTELNRILNKHNIDVASGALEAKLEAKFGIGAFEDYMSGKSRAEIERDRPNGYVKKGSK